MHPDIQFQLAQLRCEEQLLDADRRRLVHQRPRPPSRVRRGMAAQLVRVAAWLTREPVPTVPRRA